MVPSHHLNQCRNIVNWTLGNKLQWNINRNLYIFIKENAFEIVVWKMVAILSRPQCVNEKPHWFRLWLVLHQATSHNLSRCLHSAMTPYGVIKLHWVNSCHVEIVFNTLRPRDKMAAIFQTTFWNAFSWMKMYQFRLRFHWSLFPRVKLTIFQHWFR